MPDNHATHTEPDKIRALPVLATTIGFTVFAAICLVALLAYYRALVGPGLYVPPRPFPAPELQTSPLSDLEKLQSAQLARIERYGWVDQSKGLFRIPIGRAMEIVASKGARGPGAVGAGAKPAAKRGRSWLGRRCRRPAKLTTGGEQ